VSTGTLDREAHERVIRWSRAPEHFGRWCARVLKIVTKEHGLQPLAWNFAQRHVAEIADAQLRSTGRVRIIILKARQEGLSTWVAARLFWRCSLWPFRRGMVLADKLKRTHLLYDIYEVFRDRMPPGGMPHLVASSQSELAWATGSRLSVDTAGDVDIGRAGTIHLLHASEVASYEHAEDVWISLGGALAKGAGSEAYLESTAKGVGNLFHRLWLQAVARDSNWKAVFLPWFIHEEYALADVPAALADAIASSDDPFEREAQDTGILWPEVESGDGRRHKLTISQLAWRRREIADTYAGDERAFRQENPATAREAFLVSGATFFDADALAAYVDAMARAEIFRGLFRRAGGGLALMRDERGAVRVWEWPDQHGHYVVFGDTAEGRLAAARDTSFSDPDSERGGRDFCSADILKVSELVTGPDGKSYRVPCLRQVAQIHARLAPDVFAEQVYAAAAYWSCKAEAGREIALTGIERNHSSGQTVLRRLRETHHHPRLFHHRRMNVTGKRATTYLGWVTDGTTRRPMLDELAELVRRREIEVYSAQTLDEMATFVLDDAGRPEAQEGCHDDRVISLAGAVQMRHHHTDEPTGAWPELEVADTPTGT